MGLREEIEADDAAALRKRLAKKTNLEKDLPGAYVPPLMYALRKTKYAAAEALLHAGASTGRPLAICAGDPDGAGVRWLLDHGADINAPPGALASAAAFNRHEIVRLLIERGAKPDVLDDDGESALLHAAEQGALESVSALLDAGARLDIVSTKSGRTVALAAAVRHGHEVLRELDRRGVLSVVERDANGWTALHFAAARQTDAVPFLLDKGAELHARSTRAASDRDFGHKWAKGSTPLHVAAAADNAAAIALLLARGADAAATDDEGKTALDVATRAKHAEAISALNARA
jgi:uncharacterized protein